MKNQLKRYYWFAFLVPTTNLQAASPTDFHPANIPAEVVLHDGSGIVLTAEDLADPPAGEIRKRYLHDFNRVRTKFATDIAAVPMGPDGKESPWMPKLKALKAKMDQIAASRLQRDVIDFIPLMIEFLEGRNTPGFSEFFVSEQQPLRDLGVAVVPAITEHVLDQNGNVTESDLAHFVTVFGRGDLTPSSAWEGEEIPIDGAGIMIMDAPAVVTRLKAMPWKSADNFLLGDPAAVVFERYGASGSGLACLKVKYAANKSEIDAKWAELSAWVAGQRSTNP